MKKLVFLLPILFVFIGCNLLVNEEKNITVEATCVNGTITPSKVTLPKGDSVIFKIVPEDGYFVEKILVDQKSIEIPSDNTFSVSDISSDILVKVYCKKKEIVFKDFTISANVIGIGGNVSPQGDVTVKEGTSKTFTFKIDDGYEMNELKVNDTIVPLALSHTFSNVSSDQKLEVSFKKDSIIWYLEKIVWRLDSTYFYTEEDGMRRYYDFDRNLTWEFLSNGTCAETVDGNTIYPLWSVDKTVSPAILTFDDTVNLFHFKIETLNNDKLIYSWVVSEKEKRWGIYVRERYK